MDKRYLDNPFPDYQPGQAVDIPRDHVLNLLKSYVETILVKTEESDGRGDLYVGDSGIAYMFWKLAHCPTTAGMFPSLEYAQSYINRAKKNASKYKKKADERCAFLCGNAGVFAVSAAISHDLGANDVLNDDLKNFLNGYDICREITFNSYGCDEILVGRAGYLSGCYWLNNHLEFRPISNDTILDICRVMVESGRQYAKGTNSPLPLMYQYHGTEYLGAAHGLTSILHMLLESPWFKGTAEMSQTKLADIKASIDFYVSIQDNEGNFPISLEDLDSRSKRGEKRLVHWCHGAPGAIYLMVKSFLTFNDPKYLNAAELACNLIWKKGLLLKGPGICHGVAGNGYAFLILYRLTENPKYLYRAEKFMEFLTTSQFKQKSRVPDRPFSLYEGLAGTVCFLVDLLHPKSAEFPFMDVFF